MLSAMKRKLGNVNKTRFGIRETILIAACPHSAHAIGIGAKIGENQSITRCYPIGHCRLSLTQENKGCHADSFRTLTTACRTDIDRFSPKRTRSDLQSLHDDPANRSLEASEISSALLLLLNNTKFLFCSHQRTAPGSPSLRTIA